MIGAKHFKYGSKIFGATKCEHSKKSPTDACSTCTECFICLKVVGDGDLLAYLEDENTIYCHPSCTNPKMVKELRLSEDGDGVSIRLYTPIININSSYRIPTNTNSSCRPPSGSHWCKCCGAACKPEEETLIYDRMGTQLHYHTLCLQYSDVCCVCKKGPTVDRFIMAENKLYHDKCCPRYICVICGDARIHYDLSTWYAVNGKEIYVHRKCIKSVKCISCQQELDNTEYGFRKIKNDGNGIQHLNCKSDKCPICYKPIGMAESVKTLTSDRSRIDDESHSWEKPGYTLCHKSCASKPKCTKCKLPCENIEEFIIGVLDDYHRDCSTEICSLCSKIIGPNPKTIIDGGIEYHTACLNLAICYVCRGLGYGEKTFDAGIGFRHTNCSIKKCHECYQYMGQSQGLVIEGKLYHGDPIRAPLCSPVCDCCSTRNFHNKEIHLKLQSNGRYRHTTCNGSPCIVCNLPLGRTESMQDIHNLRIREAIQIHKQCSSICPTCKAVGPIIAKIGLDSYMTEENKSTLPRILKRAWITFYLVLTHKPAGVNIPKDVVRLILETFICSEQFRIIAPIRKGVFDLRLICNSYRCATRKVCICGDLYFWTWRSHFTAGCHPDRCRRVTDAMREIMEVIFERKDLSYDWPENEEAGLTAINIAVVKTPIHKLDSNRTYLYRMMMDSITGLIGVRAARHSTDSDEDE